MRLSGVEFPVMNLNDSTEEGILVPASWAFTLGLHTSCNRSIFSRTRRSRSDGSHSLTHSLSVSTDSTDVTRPRKESKWPVGPLPLCVLSIMCIVKSIGTRPQRWSIFRAMRCRWFIFQQRCDTDSFWKGLTSPSLRLFSLTTGNDYFRLFAHLEDQLFCDYSRSAPPF